MKFRYDKVKEKLIVQEASQIEYNQMKIWLKRKVKGYKFQPLVKQGLWSGDIDFYNDGSVNLGLWKECLRGCDAIGTKFEVINKKDFPLDRNIKLDDVQNFCDEFFKYHKVKDKKTGEIVPFTPYDYQVDAAFKILKNRYCLSQIATSGGKSLVMSIVFFYILSEINPDSKILVILPSITLIVQLHDNLIEYNEGFNKENKNPIDLRCEEIMSDRPRKYEGSEKPNIYLATFQSLAKTENWKDEFFQSFDVVSVDEAHKSKSVSLKKILEKTFTHAKYRFGVSGTFPEGLDDNAEMMTIESLTGPIVTNISAKSLQDKGTVANLKIKCITLNHDDHEFANQLSYIRSNPNLGSKAYQLERKYVQNSDKRNEFVSKLVGKFKKNGLLLFNIIEYGKRVLEKLENDHPDIIFLYIDGEVKKKDRSIILKDMELEDGKVRILLATFATIGTGTSINNIHSMIFLDSYKSPQLILQAVGRIMRLHEDKDKGIIFDLIDVFRESSQKNSFYRHGVERKKMYKDSQYPFDDMKFLL